MKIKMLITDLDGTLLNGQDQISSCDRNALLRVQDAGVKVVIATGRPLEEALWCVNEVNAYPYFIGMNGCQTVNLVTGEIYHQAILNRDAATRIIGVLGRLPVFFEMYGSAGVESLACKQEWIYKSGLHNHFIQNVQGHILFQDQLTAEGKTVYKFFVPTESPRLSELLIRELSPIPGISIITSLGSFVEVIPDSCNKAVGLKAICRAAGISSKEVMAAGDSQNDMEMLALSGIGAAVGNAKTEVKAAADLQLPDHDHGGIAAAVDYILISNQTTGDSGS